MNLKLNAEIGKNFCYAPWTNIHITTNGNYKTCCAGTINIGNLKTTDINNIVENTQLAEIKNALVNNEYHDNCKTCVRSEQHSSESERNWYESIAESSTINLNSIYDSHLQNLDIRWSNTCNLSCVYCDSWASSQWAAYKKIPVERQDYKNTLNGIVEFISKNKLSLKQISLLGGEPLLQKENEVVLDAISDNVLVYVITNLSVPLETNKVFQKLIQKNNVVWDISFETIDAKFEYVRHGASWEFLLYNINYLKQITKHKPGYGVAVTSQYSVYNALEISKIYNYFETYNLPMMRWNELADPEILSVAKLPQIYIDKAIQELQACEKYHSTVHFLKEMIASLQKVNSNTKDCEELYNWHTKQENEYWPNTKYKFRDLWPEYRD